MAHAIFHSCAAYDTSLHAACRGSGAMTQQTTDLSEVITSAVVAYLSGLKPVQDVLGRAPCKIFGGTVPDQVNGTEIAFPYAIVNEAGFEEIMAFSGGTGEFSATLTIAVIAETLATARRIHATLRQQLSAKVSVTWNERLFVSESQCSAGSQVPILLPDGYPAPQQQIVGELFLLCQPLPVST